MHLIFNILIFLVILNIDWVGDKIKRRPTNKTVGELLTIPILLGLALTLVDNLRIVFIYRLLIFIILSIVIYIAYSKLKKITAKKS